MVSRRKLLIGGAAGIALVAAGAVTWWLNSDEETPESSTPDPTWTAALPPFGEAVMTRIVGGTVLVVQETGLAAFDRATGDERWRLDLADEATTLLGPVEAARYVRVAGDVCVIPRYDETVVGAKSFEVLALATGKPRYTAELDGADGVDVEVAATSLVVRRWYGNERQRFTAHTLTDGEELWSRELGPLVTMPAPFSLRNQLVDVVSGGPIVLEPATDLALFDDQPNVTVFSLADGKDVASWTLPRDANGSIQVVGGHLVSDGTEGRLTGYDRLTGDTLWSRETLHNFNGEGPSRAFSLTGDLLMDADDRGGHFRIDLRSGDIVEYPDLGGRKLLGVGDGYVALDEEKAELVGFAVDGEERWKTSLRPDPLEAYAARPDALLVGDGKLVLSGGLGSQSLADQYLWVVDMATGALTVVPGGVLSGWEEGALAAVTLDEPGVLRVWELG